VKELRRLLGFLRPFAGLTLLAVLAGFATVAAGVGLLGTSAYLIARAAQMPSIAELQVAIVGVRFFGISRGIFRYLERLTGHSVNLRLQARLREWFFAQVEPLAPAQLQDERGGDLLARVVVDIETLENLYVRLFGPALVALATTTAACVLVGFWHALFAVELFAGLLVCGWVAPWLAYHAQNSEGAKLVERRSALSGLLLEGIQGMTDLTAMNAQQQWLDLVQDEARQVGRLQQRMGRSNALLSAMNLCATHLTTWLVLVSGVGLASAGRLDGIMLAVVVLVVQASFEGVVGLTQAAGLMPATLTSARRIFEITEREPAVVDDGRVVKVIPQPGLEVRDLTFAYQVGLQPVLSDFQLTLPYGTRMGMVGLSGSGKSTLVNLLLRFWDYDSGSIRLGDVEIRRLTLPTVRAQFAVLEPRAHLFDASLRQNLRIGMQDASDERLTHALAQVGMADWLMALPGGLDAWLGEQGTQLSGGERQRIGAARALLKDAPIHIMDEPTAHLDKNTARAFMRLVLERTQGKSLLWISHQLDGLDELDQVVVVEAGRVVEQGSHRQLLLQGGAYTRLWQAQQGQV
jgi:ATP-binding cassette subfamily C protein CydC